MSQPERWIVIPNWADFQHYQNRDPVWIKNYRELLTKDEYVDLPLRQRAILHGLWLLYAASDGLVSGVSPVRVGRLLGDDTVRERDLASLNHAGFIAFSASKPLALSKQRASLEKEVDKEKASPTSKERAREQPPTSTKPTCPCGVECRNHDALREHLENVHWLEGDQLEQALAAASP